MPRDSLQGNLLLVASDGTGFRAAQHYLQSISSVMAGLLSEQSQALQQTAASGQPLLVPLTATANQIHMALQVRLAADC